MEKKRKEELRLRRGFFKITARDVCGDKIKTFFYIMFWGLLICFPYNVQSQNFESYFAPLGDMVTLGAIIENPNLQSQDMQNYIAYVNSGDNCINNAKYADAMSYYKEASNIINRTYDGNLKKLYFNYGWGDALKQSYDFAYSKYKSQQPQTNNSYGDGGGSYYVPSTPSTGEYSNSTTPKSRTCNLCHGTGRKIKLQYAAGKEKICSECGGIKVSAGHYHVTCDLCHGSGVLNY